MKIKVKYMLILTILLLFMIAHIGCSPVREFYRFPDYKGQNKFSYSLPDFDQTKKTILIVADNKGTEIFDLLAPFYLFNLTHQANVFIVAEKKYPIVVMKGFFTLPHFTYNEVDSLHIQPSAIVIPNLSAMNKKEVNSFIVEWIKNKYSDTTKILSVCVGSLTAASTGLYDGKPLTTHASEFKNCEKQFSGPKWVKNTSVTKSNNLYSTGGVSNAVEGSLTLIRDMFGEHVLRAVIDSIQYPNYDIKMQHNSIALSMGSNLTIANKIYLKKNRKIGVLLQNGVDEFQLAAVLDTYHRTFPGSIETFLRGGESITTKHGLTVIPTGDFQQIKKLDELHVLRPDTLSKTDKETFANTTLVQYNASDKVYIIDRCLKRIKDQYGDKFENIVRLLLDYN
jgi:putative intracellular protease/amidase